MRDPGRGSEMAGSLPDQGYGYRRQPEATPFHGRRDGAGIEDIVTEICAVIDPGHHHVRVGVEQTGDSKMDAVSRRSIDKKYVWRRLEDPQRSIESQGVAGPTAIALGRDDNDISQWLQRCGQCLDPT